MKRALTAQRVAALALAAVELSTTLLLTSCTPHHAVGNVLIYTSEDLAKSGGGIPEPVDALNVLAPLPGAWACDAIDKAGIDPTQYYVSCTAFIAAHGHYVN